MNPGTPIKADSRRQEDSMFVILYSCDRMPNMNSLLEACLGSQSQRISSMVTWPHTLGYNTIMGVWNEEVVHLMAGSRGRGGT